MALPGNTLDALKQALQGTKAEILTPGQDGYDESIKRFSDAAEKKAGAVVFVTTAEEIASVVNVARDNKAPFVVSAGRHSTGASSSVDGDGVVIDLRKMRKVTVDAGAKTITAEGGAIWEDVDVEAAKHGLATVGGTVNHTGIGGLTLGGGFGWLSGQYGLTIDNLLSAKIILADGSIVTASEKSNPDLFWAIRGCGQSFGIAAELTFRAYEQKNPVWSGLLIFTPDKLEGIVEFSNHHDRANDGRQCFFFGFSAPHGQPAILVAPFYNGPEEEGKEYFAKLLDLGPVVNQAGVMPYEKLNGMLNTATTFGGRKTGGGSAVRLPLDFAFIQGIYREFEEFLTKHEGVGESLILFELIPYGNIAKVPLEATAHGSRGDYYNVGTLLKWYDAGLDSTIREFSRGVHKKVREQGGTADAKGVGAYSNYMDYQTTPEKVFGVNTSRLVELKKKYDPQNLFYRWHDLLA